MNLKSIINLLRPISFWRMDNFSGNNIYDEYQNNILINNNAVLDQIGCKNTNLSNKSVNLKGGYLDSTNNSLTNSQNISGDLVISFNLKCDTEIIGQHPIVSKWFPDNQWFIGFENGLLVAKYQTDTTLLELYIDNKEVIYNGRWNHVIFTVNQTHITLSMNGDNQSETGVASMSITGSPEININSPFRIGGDVSYTFSQDCFVNDIAITGDVSYSALAMYNLTRSEEERYLDLAPTYYFDITEAVDRGTTGEVINKGSKGDTIKGYLSGNDISSFTLANHGTFNNRKMVEFSEGSYFTIDDILELDLTGDRNTTIMMDNSYDGYTNTTLSTALLYPFYFSNTNDTWRYNTILRAYNNNPLFILETFDVNGVQLNSNSSSSQLTFSVPSLISMGMNSYQIGNIGEQKYKMFPVEYIENKWDLNYPTIDANYTPTPTQTFSENKFFWNDGIGEFYYKPSIGKLIVFNRNVSYLEQKNAVYPEPIIIASLLRYSHVNFGWCSGITNVIGSPIKEIYSGSFGRFTYSNINMSFELQHNDPLYNRLNDWNGSFKGLDNTSYIKSYGTILPAKHQFLYQLFVHNLNTTSSYKVMSIGDSTTEYLTVNINQRNGVFNYGSVEITSNWQIIEDFQSSSPLILNDGFHLISVARLGNRLELYIDGILDDVTFTPNIPSIPTVYFNTYANDCYINNIMYIEGETDTDKLDNVPEIVEFTFQGYSTAVSGTTTIESNPIPSTIHTLDSKSLSKLETTLSDNNGNFTLNIPKSAGTRGLYLMSLPVDENATSNVVVHGPYDTSSTYEQNITEVLGDVQDMIIDMEPELYYPMNDTSLPILDHSGNNLTGTIVGSDFTLNQSGSDADSKSILFGALGNTYIDLPAGQFSDYPNGFTFSIWFKQNTTPPSNEIPLLKIGADDSNSNGYFKIDILYTSIYFMTGTDAVQTIIPYTYDIGVWINLIMRIKSDLSIQIILNGTVLWSGFVPNMPLSQVRDFAKIGFTNSQSVDDTNLSHGTIYDYPLSDEDISKQVNRGFGFNAQTLKSNILFDSPEAYYTFDRLKTIGSEVGSYDLTINGSVIYSKNSVVVNDNVVGNNYMYNNTYKIDPVTNGGSIEFNFKTTGTHTQSIIVSEWNNTTSTGSYKFTLIAGGVLRVYLVDELNFIDSSILFNDSKFHHVILTISGNDVELFVDNVSQGTLLSISNTYGIHRMTVGSDDTGDTNAKLASKTWIDDLAFYGKVLGNVRRTEHYDKFVDKKGTLIYDI